MMVRSRRNNYVTPPPTLTQKRSRLAGFCLLRCTFRPPPPPPGTQWQASDSRLVLLILILQHRGGKNENENESESETEKGRSTSNNQHHHLHWKGCCCCQGKAKGWRQTKFSVYFNSKGFFEALLSELVLVVFSDEFLAHEKLANTNTSAERARRTKQAWWQLLCSFFVGRSRPS